MVIVYLRKNCFLAKIYNKLKNKNFDPYQILKKINDNVYVVDLPKDITISPPFNVVDLFKYHTS